LSVGPFCRKGFSPQGELVAGCSVGLLCSVAVISARPIWTWHSLRSLVAARREVLLGKQDLLQRNREVLLGKQDLLQRNREVLLGKQDLLQRSREVLLGKQDLLQRSREVLLGKQDLLQRSKQSACQLTGNHALLPA